jgi:hypothetical protein
VFVYCFLLGVFYGTHGGFVVSIGMTFTTFSYYFAAYALDAGKFGGLELITTFSHDGQTVIDATVGMSESKKIAYKKPAHI